MSVSSKTDARAECYFIVPARTNIREFLNEKGEHHFIQVAEKIYSFIQDTAANMGCRDFQKIKPHIFEEIITNSYDAFASSNSRNPSLVFKVVVERKKGSSGDEQIVIKIKDNGTGFKNRLKSEKFEFAPSDISEKPQESNIGGMGIGLRNFINEVNQAAGTVLIKNRKEDGCTISLHFNVPKPLPPPTTKNNWLIPQFFKSLFSF